MGPDPKWLCFAFKCEFALLIWFKKKSNIYDFRILKLLKWLGNVLLFDTAAQQHMYDWLLFICCLILFVYKYYLLQKCLL